MFVRGENGLERRMWEPWDETPPLKQPGLVSRVRELKRASPQSPTLSSPGKAGLWAGAGGLDLEGFFLPPPGPGNAWSDLLCLWEPELGRKRAFRTK